MYIHRYFVVMTNVCLYATLSLATTANSLTVDQMKRVTAGAISTSSDTNSNFGAFSRARGSIVETHVNIGDTFARAGGTANTLDSAGDASSNSQAIGIPDTRHLSPSVAPDIPNRGMIHARPLKLRAFKPLL
ncbi:MAG: hypothetical protein V3U75_02995 [Methylococcaceae bacterium]